MALYLKTDTSALAASNRPQEGTLFYDEPGGQVIGPAEIWGQTMAYLPPDASFETLRRAGDFGSVKAPSEEGGIPPLAPQQSVRVTV